MNQDNVIFHKVGDAGKARQIAVRHQKGALQKSGLFWLSGFKSSMRGQKAEALAQYCRESDRSFTRFDYSGHGLSGGTFEECVLSHWLEESLCVFERFTNGPQILIGSSMGGWIAIRLAQSLRPERIKAMVLIAPAWDMTEKLMQSKLTDEISEQLRTRGYFTRPSAYGDGDYTITQKLLEDGKKHLVGDLNLKIGAPVHILHGLEDPDVPWEHGHELLTRLVHDEASFTLVPDGDHRLSRPQDLELLLRIVDRADGL